ncbi:ABC transporter ATP-binding protein [Desulfopila inferna]|uniref:ABC transporter ATP-binding protein n=1 Tax=Desulfopila inferna TaxID=468528 RepID=UPI001964CBAB|nr:ABC transporter ATP-binding protein [Desulfopila inferna]MBM9603179.1 ABC transporter ATP-binding protein [Desulfopila inferna]
MKRLIIDVKDVSKTYPKEIRITSQPALQNLSLRLYKGETVGLIGANGAGKSTTIKLLLDFIRPNQGKILLFDSQPSSSHLRARLGYLPEIANFPSNLSILNLLRYTAATCGMSTAQFNERSYHLLNMLELWKVRCNRLGTYSKGMQQRANFAVALINDPELLILDEPMSGLDPMGRQKIIDLIYSLKDDGKTILFCSHILEDVDRLVDKVLLLHKGRKVFYGTPDELTNQEDESSFADAFVSRVRSEEKKSA